MTDSAIQKLPDQPLSVNGTLRYLDQAISLQDISGKLGDTSVEVDGRVMNAPELDGSELRFSISSSDIHQLHRNEVLGRLPAAFAIGGQLRYRDNSVGMTGFKGKLGDAAFEADGRLANLPELTGSQVRFTVNAPDLHKFFRHEMLDSLPGRFAASGEVSRDAAHCRFSDLQVDIGSTHVELGGMVDELPGVSELDLSLSVAGASLSELDGIAKRPLPDWVFRLAARVKGQTEELEFDGLSFVLGPSDVSGDLQLSLVGQKGISGKLHSNLLDLSWLGGEAVDAADAVDDSADPRRPVFPDTPIPLRGEDQPRVDLAVSVDRLLTIRSKVEAIKVGVYQDNNVLRIDPMQMQGQRGGGIRGSFVADRTSGTPRVLFELFNVLNPLADKSEHTNVDCGVMALNAEQGVFTSIVPVNWQTEEITIISGGTVDLGAERLDLGFNTKVRKGIGISASMVVNPLIKLGGTLSSPSIELDPTGTAVSGSITVATAGLSLISKALWDRFFSSRDPCGEAIKQIEKIEAKEQQARR